MNGALFFAAQDIEHGNELWKTDGTLAGTVLVKDINPGTASSNPSKLFNMDGTLFFWTKDDENSWKLWKSDGTGEGTALVSVFEGTESRDPGDESGASNRSINVRSRRSPKLKRARSMLPEWHTNTMLAGAATW